MNLFNGFLTKKDNFSDASANTESGKGVKTDYQNQVDEAVKALNKGKFSKFKEIATSAGDSIMQDEKIHSACVDVLKRALNDGSEKKALKFCKALSEVLPKDGSKTLIVGLVQEAADSISNEFYGSCYGFSLIQETVRSLPNNYFSSNCAMYSMQFQIPKGALARMANADELFKEVTFEKVKSDVKITILDEINEDDFIDNYPGEDEDISESQLRILKEIKNHPESLVFLDQLYEDCFPQLFNEYELAKKFSDIAKELFPNIPEDFSALTKRQKVFLRFLGGVKTAFYLGLISEIHKSLSLEDQRSIAFQLAKIGRDPCYRRRDYTLGDASRIYVQRDEFLEREIAQVTSRPENEGKEVIIVVGKRRIVPLCVRFEKNEYRVIPNKFRDYDRPRNMYYNKDDIFKDEQGKS